MAERRVIASVGVLALAAAGVSGYLALRSGLGPLPDPEGCAASTSDHSVALSLEQAENASLISAVAERRGLPARAVTIAIATAYQESDLQNLDGGDRDSLGLFQQRPSQGWGSPAQILDPYYATNAFYDALVEVDGYQTMDVTDAAQAVQRSGFPQAYADHEQDGRTIASALTGYSEAAFTCTVNAPDTTDESQRHHGLTPRADAVRRDLATAFGDLDLGGLAAGGSGTGPVAGSAHDDGRALDVLFRPISDDNTRRGWVLAHYLVANAARLHIAHVIFDDRIWTAGARSAQGWRDYDAPTGHDPARQAILEHRDHVHVDVA